MPYQNNAPPNVQNNHKALNIVTIQRATITVAGMATIATYDYTVCCQQWTNTFTPHCLSSSIHTYMAGNSRDYYLFENIKCSSIDNTTKFCSEDGSRHIYECQEKTVPRLIPLVMYKTSQPHPPCRGGGRCWRETTTSRTLVITPLSTYNMGVKRNAHDNCNLLYTRPYAYPLPQELWEEKDIHCGGKRCALSMINPTRFLRHNGMISVPTWEDKK